MDVHLVVMYAVHYCMIFLLPSFFKSWPVHAVMQGRHTDVVIKVADDIAGMSVLSYCWCYVWCTGATLVKHIPQLV